MRLTRFLVAFWLALPATQCLSQAPPPHFMRTPDIHGDSVVFSCEGDLWLASIAAKTARRITADSGVETHPRFSPDGSKIAFTGEYDGGRQVYVMPTQGGAPVRITYATTGAEMVCWSPDGQSVVYRTSAGLPLAGPRLYRTSARGGNSTPFPMPRSAQASFAPDGSKLAWCMLPLEEHNWKRYHGGQANHIWIADLKASTYRRIDAETVNEQYPTWVGGSVYYVSEKDGTANLWRWDPRTGARRRVTSHDTYDVRAPSSDGRTIVYEWGDRLYRYDPATGSDQPLVLEFESDRLHARPYVTAGTFGEFALGPTGKRLAGISRGQLFSIPVKDGDIRPIAPAPGTRSSSPAWSPDGKSVAFVSDRSGEQNIWIAASDAATAPYQLTQVNGIEIRQPVWSPDGKAVAWADNALNLWQTDIATHKSTLVAHSDRNELTDFAYSPDSRWIAYTLQDARTVRSIYLYAILTEKTTRVSQATASDHDPVFDRGGKYLFFLSERGLAAKDDAIDFQTDFLHCTRIYAVALATDTVSPFADKDDEEGTAEKPAPKADKAATTPTRVDLDGIGDRIIELPPAAGDYSSTAALDGKILYSAGDDDGARKLMMYDLAEKKETTLASGVQAYDVSADGKMVAIRTAAGVQVGAAGSPLESAGKVDVSGWKVAVDPALEWRQIFEEAWRSHRDTFYDPHMHGQDWDAIRRKYEALLPAVGCRAELNYVLGNMEGEVNVSHEFVGGGSDRVTALPGQAPASLGADFAWDPAAGSYRITRLYAGDGFDFSARSPLLDPGLNVKVGDHVTAIAGTTLTADIDPDRALLGRARATTAIALTPANGTGKRTVRVKPLASDSAARYYGWIQSNRDYITVHGGPNIGYVHIPNMEGPGMEEFSKQFYANLDKDGMILDVRFNGGGITSGQVLDHLTRVIFEYDQARYGLPTPYHFTAYTGRVVVICNERSSSDAEYFCTGFRYEKLGGTVGTRTWGGFMAVNGSPTIDGGFVAHPIAGSFSPDLKWLPDGTGFTPDVEVEEDPGSIAAGRDPQLDAAIAMVQEEIRRQPVPHVGRIDPPSAAKAFKPNRP